MTTIRTGSGYELSVEDDFESLKEKVRNTSGYVDVRLADGGRATVLAADAFVLLDAE